MQGFGGGVFGIYVWDAQSKKQLKRRNSLVYSQINFKIIFGFRGETAKHKGNITEVKGMVSRKASRQVVSGFAAVYTHNNIKEATGWHAGDSQESPKNKSGKTKKKIKKHQTIHGNGPIKAQQKQMQKASSVFVVWCVANSLGVSSETGSDFSETLWNLLL